MRDSVFYVIFKPRNIHDFLSKLKDFVTSKNEVDMEASIKYHFFQIMDIVRFNSLAEHQFESMSL